MLRIVMATLVFATAAAPWSIATAERTYDPTQQIVVPVEQAVVVTYVEAYDPITNAWIGTHRPVGSSTG
jgi:hypothetical protein